MKESTSKKMNYAAAFEELQQIVTDIEDGEIGVDALAEKVKRAAELIRICKNTLSRTEESVSDILNTLENEEHPSR